VIIAKQGKNIYDCFNSFIISAEEAIENDNEREACLKWQKHLGPRFKCNNTTQNTGSKAAVFSNPDVIRGNATSA